MKASVSAWWCHTYSLSAVPVGEVINSGSFVSQHEHTVNSFHHVNWICLLCYDELGCNSFGGKTTRRDCACWINTPEDGRMGTETERKNKNRVSDV